jgi:hypothetical protein
MVSDRPVRSPEESLSRTEEPSLHYYLPARRLDGTRTEVLAQLDELLVSLAGLRQLVSLHGPKPSDAPGPKLRLVKQFVKRAAPIVGILLLALPASAQVQARTVAASPDATSTSAQRQVIGNKTGTW